ncbi:MAG: hypothetical protein IKN04_20550 [Clostridia bacterium]|nr:hypothetical protein [Clostridia bacterium]MBR6187303.1 hypothetical protein [Clostridia bacterium]
MKKTMVRRRISLSIHLIIVIIVAYVWISEARVSGWMMRDRYGLSSLRTFTTLSNLFQGLASALYVFSIMRSVILNRESVPRAVRVIKYAAAVSVTVTFLTVVLYIGPSRHDMADALFCGNNRYFHFLIPLLAITDQVVFDREGSLKWTDSLMAAAPTVMYGIFYWVNIAVNGAGEEPYSNDWYGFLNFGYVFAPIIYGVFVLIAWGIALLFRLPRRHCPADLR